MSAKSLLSFRLKKSTHGNVRESPPAPDTFYESTKTHVEHRVSIFGRMAALEIRGISDINLVP
jgi:hypothetical protein